MGYKIGLTSNGAKIGGSLEFYAMHDGSGQDDLLAARNATLAEVPGTYDGDPLKQISGGEVNHEAGYYLFQARYGVDSSSANAVSLSEVIRDQLAPGATTATRVDRFSGTAPSGQIYASLSTISVTDKLGDDAINDREFGGLINVERDGAKLITRGLDLQAPPANVLVDLNVRGAPVDAGAIKVVQSALGTTNDAGFVVSNVNYSVGELLFVNLDIATQITHDLVSGKLATGTRISIGFAYAGNKTDIQIGSNAAMKVDKKGHEYLWVYSEPSVANGITTLKPEYALVEKVWPDSSYVTWLGAGL